MKKIKALYLGMAVALAAGALSSCQADMDAPALVEPKATMQPNTTISDFKTVFENATAEQCPMKDEATQTPYIVHGRVVSSDATGNIYKSIVIQDETAAIALSVNQGSTYTDYRIGQEVVVNASGLYIGYYNGLQQLGWYDLYDGSPSLSFMAWDIFLGHSELNGFPNPDVKYVTPEATWPSDNPYCIVTSISQLPAAGEDFRNMQSQLVEFRNVYFEDGGKETYAPYQESVNRVIKDAAGNEIICRTSGYSNFYNDTIPEGVGTVRGILSYYGDAWQLLLRGKGDVMITKEGQKDEPYSVEQALELENQGTFGWIKAYIVGSVKAGVNDVASNSDVVFGATDAEMDNNILIAADKDCKDWSKCIVVELPQGSAFRAKVNLVDNPDCYQKEILVNGYLETFLGMPGLTGNGGTASDVEVEGVEITNGGGDTPTPGGAAIPAGSGTQESPYNVEQIRAAQAATGVWAEGYVVGYCSGSNWDTAVFSNQAPTEESTNWTNGTNIIISMLPPGQADKTNSCAAGLKNVGDLRTMMAISKNPDIYGARVKLKGEIAYYFQGMSMKNCEAYEIVSSGNGGQTPVDPTPTPGEEVTIFSGLGKSLTDMPSDWTIQNVTMPAGKTDAWSWTVYSGSGYLYGTLYGATGDGLAYAISPEIDLTGYKTVSASFRHAAKFQTTLRTLCGFCVRVSGTTTWTDVTIPTWPTAGAWTWADSGALDLSAFAGKKVQVAFKYGCSAAGADSWEINDLNIVGTK